LLGSGCTTVADVVGGREYSFVECDLDDAALARRIDEIDGLYREPRTVEKVAASLALSEVSISRRNEHAALWRAVRACAWLAQRHPDRDAGLEFGRKGIVIGIRAVALKGLARQPEPHYYLALAMGNFCEEEGTCDPEFVEKMRDHAEQALAADEGFDHCGPHRFLGKLIVEAADTPGYAVGSWEEGLEHLQAAVAKCPEFPENWLFLGETLAEDDQVDAARSALERVIASQPPPDHGAEHAEWVAKAKELLEDF
jgi:tetratricopeptide (TPR) repeat protein